MADKKKKSNSGGWMKYLLWILIILAILSLVGALIYGGTHGWFSGDSSTIYINNESDDGSGSGSTQDVFDSCEELCVSENYHSGYEKTGDCADGTTQINYGYANEDPLLECCCVPDPESEEEEDDGGYSVGDIITQESDEGTMGNGINTIQNPIEMPDIELGGDCHLGAKIDVWWDYVDEADCSGIQGFETMAFYFFDSNTGVALDVPRDTEKHFDLCPKYYDGETDWMFEMTKLMGMYSCEVDYDYSIEVYVCECD